MRTSFRHETIGTRFLDGRPLDAARAVVLGCSIAALFWQALVSFVV